MTTASAPRGMMPPVAMAVAVAPPTSSIGAWPQAITSALSVSTFGRAVAGAERVERAHGEAVDIGAVERRRIGERDHVVRQHAAERVGKRARVRPASGVKVDAAAEARARLLGRYDFEELLLPRRGAHAREQVPFLRGIATEVAWLMATAIPERRSRRNSPRFPPARAT